MLYPNLFLALILTLFSNALHADEIAIPTPGEDLEVTGGVAVKDFFAKRALPSTCRTQFEKTYAQYRVLKQELDKLVAAKAPASQLDPKEAEVIKFRKNKLQPLTEECGYCATQEVTPKTVHTPTGSQDWLMTDGSCFNPGASPEESEKAFEAAVQLLTDSKLFVRQRGGIESILEFVPVNRRTGAFLPHALMSPGTTVDTFIAVRGPAVAFNYLFENKIELIASPNGVKEFIVRFNGLPRPDGFKPKIKDVTLAGTERSAGLRWDISRVKGMWYVRNDGYYRYFTAADFELPLTIGTGFARATLHDTIFTLSERGR